MVSPFMPDDAKLAAVREGLPATGAGIYLNAGTAGPLPSEAAAAMAELAQWELRTGRAHEAYLEDALVRLDEARAGVAAVIHAGIDAVALTHGTTDGVNAALWSIDWRPADRLVTTSLEYPGVVAALRNLADRRGVDVEVVDVSPIDDDATVAAMERALHGGARLVLLSHVDWSTGQRLPVRRVARLAHHAGALVAVDGAQSVGAIAVDVDDLDVDFLALPAQKWLLGPEGMGALFCSRGALEQARPAMVGALGLVDEFDGLGPLRRDARAFEASNFHAPSVTGMARACSWLSMYVGWEWIVKRADGLARGALDLLAATPGVEVLTPADRMATLLTFRIAGWAANEALDEIGRRVFAIARTIPPLDAIRISVGFYNTEGEIGRFCEVVAELAAHTPETLPRRPALTILGEGGG